MKLIYAIAFAVFFLALPWPPPHSRPTCHCCRHCVPTTTTRTRLASVVLSAGEVLTIEAILAKYGVIVTDTDDEVIVLYLDDLDDTPVGSIQLGTKTQSQPTTTFPTSSWIQSLLGSLSWTRPPK